MNASSIVLAQGYSDKDLIQSILSGFYIIDYGYIQKVNGDNTIDVIHAKRLKTLQGESLPETISKNIEVLTISSSALSINVDFRPGDKVLLLGLKNYIDKVENVTKATETTVYMHYSRSTMKAIPLCLFNPDARVSVEIKNGNLEMKCSSFKIMDKNGSPALEVTL